MTWKIVVTSILALLSGIYLYDHSQLLQNSCENAKLLFDKFVTRIVYKQNPSNASVLFTETQLRTFTNEEQGLYLAILGKVYDVGKGSKHYKPGGSYHAFTGRDASRAFVTGDFSESGLTDDVMGLSTDDFTSLLYWTSFYKKEYTYKGKLIGRYYDSTGKPTLYHKKVKKLIAIAKAEKDKIEKNRHLYPSCNVEWTSETGSRVWCSNKSGGVNRDWVGVPRQYYEPKEGTTRCVCVQTDNTGNAGSGATLREYEGCSPQSTSCIIAPDSQISS